MALPPPASTDARDAGAAASIAPHRCAAGMPPLVAALDARIAAARDLIEDACLRAERAGVLACHGGFDAARAEIALLRERQARWPNAVVSAWLHLAEALMLHFAHDGAAARDRLKRALALATAVQARPVQSLAAAWLAHTDFTRLDIGPMAGNVSIALRHAPPDGHQALSRAALVAAQGFHWAGRMDLALPWYGRARTHAAAVQDEYLLSAHMHNMAWLRCAHARRVWAAGGDGAVEVAHACAGAESSGRYDALTGTAFLAGLAPLLRAQLLLLQGRHGEALVLLDAHLGAARGEGLQRLESCLLADRAWCRLHTDDAAGALDDARAALGAIGADTQIDDRAMTRTLAARVLHAFGDRAGARLQSQIADADWRALGTLHERLVTALGAALPSA